MPDAGTGGNPMQEASGSSEDEAAAFPGACSALKQQLIIVQVWRGVVCGGRPCAFGCTRVQVPHDACNSAIISQ